MLDHTHDPSLRSWIDSANDPAGDFPIQNLPFGVFRSDGSAASPRIGAAIGERVFDLRGAAEAGLLAMLQEEVRAALREETLNRFLALGHPAWTQTRQAMCELLAAANTTLQADRALRDRLILPRDGIELLLPVRIGDYTDFYASVHHATNIGSMFRPDNPLLPNYKHLPVGYHGRASTIVVSGTGVHRPMGQLRPEETKPPIFGPSRLLDYELEVGFYVGPGNEMGRRITMAEAPAHIFGLSIVNDWSARDVQKWEYQPLGPFNAKNFATTVSPWIVTLDALAPYRVPGPPRAADDPPLLDYLRPADDMALQITVELYLQSQMMKERGLQPVRLCRGRFDDMFWTIAQMLVHHTSTGCRMQPGDLLASGTISGTTPDSTGSMLELTWRGQNPIDLPDGTQRKLLQDGDEVIIRAFCEKPGVARIGFGECRGVVLPVIE